MIEQFKMKLPIKDGEWWNGKPYDYSNLPKWGCVYAQGFGENKLPLYKEIGLKGHNGLDIAYVKGTPVVAPIRCFITTASNGGTGYGKYVRANTETIDGEFLELTFGHLDEVVVETGKWVEEGTILGYGDSTGNSTGHHLHFGIRIHETLPNGNTQIKNYDNGYWGSVDPELYLPKVRWTVGELEQLNEENMQTNIKILKVENKSDIIIGLPVKSESAIMSYLDNFGVDYKVNEDGSFDWNSINIKGVVKLD